MAQSFSFVKKIFPRSFVVLGMLALLLAAGGCSGLAPQRWHVGPIFSTLSGPGGELTINSVSNKDVLIKAGFEHGIYSTSNSSTATIVLYDGTLEDPRQVLVIRMFWNPHAGKTPIDPTATNATMQYVIFPDGKGASEKASASAGENKAGGNGEEGKQVGIYSGAGYLYPNSDIGDDKLVASVWQSTLRMGDKTEGFYDRLGQSLMKGRFTVMRDDLAIQQTLHQLNVKIRQRLGKARLIRNEPSADQKKQLALN
jgi:hypothetical protein